MADDELDAIRARRMAELQQQMGFMKPNMWGESVEDCMNDIMGGIPLSRDLEGFLTHRGDGGHRGAAEQDAALQQQQEMKHSILSQVLNQEARARLNTIALTKPDKAKMVESMLCQMAQRGQIQNKLGEDQLKGLLEQVSARTQKTTVKFDRRRAALDSDSD